MLGKLIKYDLKASAPMLSICYLAVAVLSVLLGIVGKQAAGTLESGDAMGTAAAIALASLVILWGVALAGTLIAALAAVLRRFYRNLLGDQGYLTLTLPVRSGTHVLSKTVSGIVIIAVSVLVMLLGIWIPVTMITPRELYLIFQETVLGELDILVREAGILYFVNQGLSQISALLLAYLALCIGQLCQRRRILAAIGVYIGVGVLEGILRTIAGVIFSGVLRGQDTFALSFFGYLEGAVTGSFTAGNTIYLIVQCILFFWLSALLLEKRVNLK